MSQELVVANLGTLEESAKYPRHGADPGDHSADIGVHLALASSAIDPSRCFAAKAPECLRFRMVLNQAANGARELVASLLRRRGEQRHDLLRRRAKCFWHGLSVG